MSYDPSHRRPPRQERWPSATPAEGWPSYRDDAYRDGEQADGRYETGRYETGRYEVGQYETGRQGAYPATGGYRQQAGGYRHAAGGSGDAGYRSAVATDTFPGAGNGTGSFPAVRNGYAAGYGQADQGYGDGQSYSDGQGYDTNGYGANGYGAAHGYDGVANGHGGTGYGYDGASNGYGDAANGYGGAGNGYAGAVDGYAGAADDYAEVTDGFDGAADGYGWAQDGYGRGQDGNGWAGNGYSQAADGYANDDYANGGYGGGGYSDHGYSDHGYSDDGYAADGWAEPGYRSSAVDHTVDLGPGSYTEYSDPGYREPRSGDPRLTAPDAGVHPDGWQAEQDDRREARRRGMMVGAVTEVLGTAVAIGVSTLVAGLAKSQTSPIAAMGGVFIDRTPATLRNALVHHFGTHGRTVLLLGMYAAIAFAALVIGVLARRGAAVGVAGIGAFTLVAAFVAITRPAGHVGDITPAVVGGIAGVAALLWLVRASTPIAPLRNSRGGARRRTR